LKQAQGVGRHGWVDPDVLGGGDGRQGVELVVHAADRPTHLRHHLTRAQDVKVFG